MTVISIFLNIAPNWPRLSSVFILLYCCWWKYIFSLSLSLSFQCEQTENNQRRQGQGVIKLYAADHSSRSHAFPLCGTRPPSLRERSSLRQSPASEGRPVFLYCRAPAKAVRKLEKWVSLTSHVFWPLDSLWGVLLCMGSAEWRMQGRKEQCSSATSLWAMIAPTPLAATRGPRSAHRWTDACLREKINTRAKQRPVHPEPHWYGSLLSEP